METRRATHLGTIRGYLKEKYGLGEAIDMKILYSGQEGSLVSWIKEKYHHGKLYKGLDTHVDIGASSAWLRYGNSSTREEALLSYLQDRNVFFAEQGGLYGL